MAQHGVQNILQSFKNLKVLVLGDVMIDSYLWGSVSRISPEAPVPIVDVNQREKRLGGAANVALNLVSLGATPILCSLVGNDTDGDDFVELLNEANITYEGIVKSTYRKTTIKHRIIAQEQHLLRVDQEDTHELNTDENNLLWSKIEKLIPTCQVVIFEDYDKGCLNEEIIQKTIQFAKKNNIPTVVDPKKRNFYHYKGATLFKPNFKEMVEGLKKDVDKTNTQELKNAVIELAQLLEVDKALVTLSELGMMLSDNKENNCIHEPAHRRKITDVSGAGDTVVSVAALSLASDLTDKQVISLANLAGGLVCESVGVVPIQIEQLQQEAIEKRIL